jgi:hypothetical protein
MKTAQKVRTLVSASNDNANPFAVLPLISPPGALQSKLFVGWVITKMEELESDELR